MPELPRVAAAAAPADASGIEEWLLDRMLRLGVDLASFDPTTRLTELGFDSLKIVELKADLERSLGIVITVADLYNHENIQDLIGYLRSEARRLEASAPSLPQPQPAMARAARPASRLAEQRRIRGARDAVPVHPVPPASRRTTHRG